MPEELSSFAFIVAVELPSAGREPGEMSTERVSSSTDTLPLSTVTGIGVPSEFCKFIVSCL